MVFTGERCFKFHRNMLKILGLWPFHKSVIWQIQTIFFFGTYCGNLVFQFTAFLTTTCNMDCFLKRFSYISITLVYILNYYCFFFNSKTVKHMVEHIYLDWKIFQDSDAMKIFEDYLFESYIFAFSICIFVFVIGFLFVIFEWRAIILDVIMPLNESRPRKIEVDIECFIDKQQYFYLYFIGEAIGVGIGFFSMITTMSILITLAKHCCAMYRIASYLMQNTVTNYALRLPADQGLRFMHRNIYLSVYVHRRTMEFMKNIIFLFNLWFLPLILISVVSLSCVLFRLYNAIIHFHDFYDIFVSCVILYCCLIYMIVANCFGQSYTDHSIELLDFTYDIPWYIAPVSIQKLILIIHTSVRSHEIVLGGLFVLSVEGLSTLVTSALSYFTVMHAMHS